MKIVKSNLVKKISDAFMNGNVRSVLVAVSGGADSVALLHICHELSKTSGLKVEAVNCNFHLRGEESNRDSSFTAAICRKLGVKLHSLDYDVHEYKRIHPDSSTEMACRELRYSDFFRIAREYGFDRIAVAHNADDDIETMMLNMLRGSGTRGLKGMNTDNGRIIRPLLTTFRYEIEKYLKEIGQDYIVDSSNLTSDFRRNFIRREVIPLLEHQWPNAKKTLFRTVRIMKEDAEIVDKYYQEKLNKLSSGNHLMIYDDGMTPGIVHRFLNQFGGNASIADEIMEARGKKFGARKWKLDYGYEAVLERYALVVRNTIYKDDNCVSLEWKKFPMSPTMMQRIKKNNDFLTQYFPNGAEAYELRKPMKGDRISPLGMNGTRLVSDVISDEKLDRYLKSRVRVLVRKSDGEIVWVTGLKRSRHDLVDESEAYCHQCSMTISHISDHSDPPDNPNHSTNN